MGENSFGLIWWILGLPVIGFLIQSLFGKRIAGNSAGGKRVAGILAVLPIALAFGIACMITSQLASMPAEVRANQGSVQTLFQWIDLASIRIPFEVRIDTLSMTMVLIITGIGALIHLYATGYMSEEKDYTRFFTYLNLFVASMLILVLGNNLALLFIGWEGVGLCSYLLIGFWYKDLANSKAANKAFIVNRIGDVGLTLGMFMLVVVLAANRDNLGIHDARWLSYDVIIPNAVKVLQGMPGIATTIALLLFVGACGKSAQFPLYLWLPDAMAGPTPVSALIHAATMVTAGVFLLNRLNVLFQLSPVASAVIACVGAFTALFAALIAFGQSDIKKVLAYSTVSQLGFMFIACGAGAYWVGMFHVTTHAFFKALLFLGSGAVIHAMAHNQDMRNYGKLAKYLPITFFTMLIGYLAISGFPLLSGFYSKEAILGYALANHHANIEGIQLGYYAGWVGLFVAFLTAMYMTRMMFLTFWGGQERWRLIPAHARGGHGELHDTHEAHAVALEHNPVAQAGVSSTNIPATIAAAEGYRFQGELTDIEPYQERDEEAYEDTHVAHAHHDHGPDLYGFFYTDDELHAMEHAEHADHHEHHDLDENHQPHEVMPSMWIPLVVLAVLSAGGGWFLQNNQLFEKWLYPDGLSVLGELHEHAEGLPMSLMTMSLIAALGGIALGAVIYIKGLPKKEGWDESKWNPFRRWARDQFGYDQALMTASVDGGADVARFTWKALDSTLVDGAVNGSGWLSRFVGNLLHLFQTGYVRFYAMMMLFGGILLIGSIYGIWLLRGGQ